MAPDVVAVKRMFLEAGLDSDDEGSDGNGGDHKEADGSEGSASSDSQDDGDEDTGSEEEPESARIRQLRLKMEMKRDDTGLRMPRKLSALREASRKRPKRKVVGIPNGVPSP